jgi:drug/metabolite transporter (DMT)-like permease
MLWVILAGLAGPLQVLRNAAQRGLVADAGPWGATLVRFLFGLPFSIAIFAAVWALTPDAQPDPSARFWIAACLGALAQACATCVLLLAMGRSGFAVASVMQQASLPLSAVLGWAALGDSLSAQAWLGVAVTTVGLVTLSWPRQADGRSGLLGAGLGLLSAATFAIAFNGFRQAGLTLEPDHPIYAGTASVVVAQIMQTAVLTLILAIGRPQALRSVTTAWRSSLGAGFFGSAASACWFSALAMAPAGQVRAVATLETPFAALVGRKLFRERLTWRQIVGGAATTGGVIATALG